MKTTIKREGDKVWLKGVSGWFIGDRVSSVHAAQEAILRAAGQEVRYDYLVGVSGLAFRMQVSKTGLCPSSPHPTCGYQCVERSVRALPLGVRVLEAKADQPDRVAAARRAVVESIDRGLPAQYSSEEDGIIVGYQKNGEEWICYHPLRDRGKTTFVESTWPWGVAVYDGAKKQVFSRRELAVGALRQAVDMAEAGEADGYVTGLRAWREYIAKLQELRKADDKTRQEAMLGNAWVYECLAQFRGCASRYTRDVAGEFGEQAAAHLRQAADLYERMSGEVLRDSTHCVVTIAPYPWALKDGETWSDAMRQEQIHRLEAALPIERQALGEIEAALAVMGEASKAQ